MARVIVYGASDDLIEVEGDLYEEFGSYDAEGDVLKFSDGTRIGVTYDQEGQWRLKLLEVSLLTDATHIPSREEDEGHAGRDEDGCPDYSDKVILEGPLEWVKHRRGKR